MFSALWFRGPQPRLKGNTSARTSPASRRKPSSRYRLMLELLEVRTLLSAYSVITTADSGAGSLRDAITQINNDTTGQYLGSHGVDEIDFAVSGGAGYDPSTGIATITPTTALPAIQNTVFIDGYTQGQNTALAARRNTLTVGDNAVLKVVLDCTNSDGITISAANSTVEGLELENFSTGIHLAAGATGDTVAGNFINGNNSANTGLSVETSSNTVGGTDPAARNVISGAFTANVRIGFGASPAEHNIIEGNYIGTTIDGSAFAGGNDSQGVWLVNANCNTIGGSTCTARNVIGSPFPVLNEEGSGNVVEGNYIGTNAAGSIGLDDGGDVFDSGNGTLILDNLVTGISLQGEGSEAQGNLVGTDLTGSVPLLTTGGVASGNGVALGGSDNLLGGTAACAGNIIAFNAGAGVRVSGTGDRIEGNSIYGNAGLGIDLLNSGRVVSEDITTNAGNDVANHVGANNLMNFPTLTSAYTLNGATTIGGSLATGTANGHVFLPNATITLDFYANTSPDPTGFGQGQYWLGSFPVCTDSNGNVTFTATVPQAIPTGYGYITATATDPGGDTSEFCADFQPAPTSGGPYTIHAGDSLTLLAATAGPGPWTYSWTVNCHTTISVNGQGQPIPSEPITGQQPTLTWPQLQSLGIDVSNSWFTVYADANNEMLPHARLTVEATPPTASIMTSLPTDSSGNPTTPANAPITLAANVTDPSRADTAVGYSWTVAQHTPTGSLTPVPNGGEYATRVLGASSEQAFPSIFEGTLGTLTALGEQDGIGWSPDSADAAPYLNLGFDTPVYANGVTIWENAGGSSSDFQGTFSDFNGFVIRVDVLDALNGMYYTVWNGNDTSNSITEVPFTASWSQTSYPVEGVRIYTTNTPIDLPNIPSNHAVIDAVQLLGSYDPTANGSLPLTGSYDPTVNRGRSDQYATTVLFQNLTQFGSDEGSDELVTVQAPTSSEYDDGTNFDPRWNAVMALGEPNVTSYQDDPNAWSAYYENGMPDATPPFPAEQTLAVGFAIPVYADGVTIRETQGNGFVTAVDVLPEGADPITGWQTAWTGTDPTLPGAPADFTVYWPETSYLVTAVRIHVNTNQDLNSYENIDSVQLHGWFTPGTVVASGTTQELGFIPSAAGTTYVATLTATDRQGGVAMTQATIDVANTVPPTAQISTPTYSAGQVGLTLSDPAPGDQAASFTIDWGDGTYFPNVPAPNGSTTVNHTYSVSGAYLVTVTATDTNQNTSPTATALVLFSTSPADNIAVGGGPSAGQVAVTSAAAPHAPAVFYTPTDLVFLIGQDSTDSYTINFGRTLTMPITIAANGTATQGTLVANGAAGDNYFDKTSSQIAWAPNYGPAPTVETVQYSGITQKILNAGPPLQIANLPGGPLQFEGNLYVQDPGSNTTINGGSGINTIVITATSGNGVVINGGPSTNNYVIDLGSLAGPVTINDDQQTASNNLTVNGAPGNNTISMAGSQVTAGSQTIDLNAPLASATINGGSGANQITVANLTVPVQSLAINATGTSTSITLVNVGSSVASLSVAAGSGTTQVQVQGSLPANVTPVVSAGADVSFYEGLTWSGSGSFTDAVAGLPLSATVNYGDGTGTQPLTLSANDTFNLQHAFAQKGVYTVTVSVSDGEGQTGTSSFLATINANVGVVLLDSSTNGALNVSGNAILNVTSDGALVIDSGNSAAASASGNASVTAGEIDAAGGLSHSGSAAFHATIYTGAATMSDPLAALAAPSQPATQFTAVNYSGTLQPGTYIGGITVSGSNAVTLQPGIYYLEGGGLTVSGNATVTGTSVMIYITGVTGNSINLSGKAVVTLTPLTSGTYQGIVLFQNRTSNAAITISGNASLNSTGTEYAPGATVTLSGNEDTDNPTHTSLGSQWIIDDLTLSGNAQFTISADANNRNQDPNAFLVAGGPVHPAVAVAALTPGEAAAAFREALALWSAAGLDAATLRALSRAKITIEPLPAPYLGLAAPGAIYIDSTAEGYGWFTDVAARAVPPSNKIDLLTVMTHEIGHLFGLMDGNGTALMAPTLAAGARILPDAADLLAPHTTLVPAGYFQSIDTVGTAGGSLVATDQFFVQLALGLDGMNYNFGEQPQASGSVQKGQSAGIGFWNNKNGQALILALNGGTGHQLGDWLAATMPNTFGASAGSNNLTGKSNAFVAGLFQQDFLMKGVKLDAQVLATALSVYVTDSTLDSTAVAAQYGFAVSSTGLGTDSVNVGSNGDAFGVVNNTSMSVLNLLQAADSQALFGVLYNGDATKRNEANSLFSALNEAGGIS